MQHTKKPSRIWLIACALSLALLAACATPMPPSAGAVVVAPKVTLPPPPLLVQQTEPKPTGYFQNNLLNFFSSKPPAQTN